MRPKLLLLILYFSVVFTAPSSAVDDFFLNWGHSAGHTGDPTICANDYVNFWVPQAYCDPALTYRWYITGGDCYGNTIDTLFSVIYNGTSNVSVYNQTGMIWCSAYDSNNQLVATSQFLSSYAVVHPDDNGGICSNYTSLCNDRPTTLRINQNNAWVATSTHPANEFNWQLNGVDIPGANVFATYTPTVAGVYRVRFTTWCGTGYSNPITINDGGPGFNMAVNGYYYFCDGSSTPITANIANSSSINYQYLWNTGETTKTISASSVGLYEVTATNPNGCTKTAKHDMGIHYPVNPYIAPAGPVYICQSGSVTLEGGGTGIS